MISTKKSLFLTGLLLLSVCLSQYAWAGGPSIDLTLWGGGRQNFWVDDPPTAIPTITVLDDEPAITAASDLRIMIPTGFNMVWDTTDTEATIGGAQSAKVSSSVSYEDSGRILVITVITDFAAGDNITISDLGYFSGFSAVSKEDKLEMDVDNNGTNDKDGKDRIAVVATSISSAADQSFDVGDSATPISTITITEDSLTKSIRKNTTIRIRIPAGFNMTWDSSDTTATFGGTASAKVSNPVSYEDSDKTLVITVGGADFALDDTLEISGLSFKNFTAASAADNLELELYNNGVANTVDDKTIRVTTANSPLTSVSNSPDPNTVGPTPTSTHTVAFTTADALPADGKIVVTFPAGFDISGVGVGDITSSTMDGSFSASAGGQVLTITRSGGSSEPAGAQMIDIANIDNTATAGASYTVDVETQDSGGTPINGPTTSSAFTIKGKSALANPATQVTDQLTGTETTQPTDVALVGFKITPTGENLTWTDLVVSLTYGGGMADADITSAQIYVDNGTVGTYESGTDTQVGAQSVNASGGNLTWNTVGGTITAATNYLIIFDAGASLSTGETVQASVTFNDITVSAAAENFPTAG